MQKYQLDLTQYLCPLPLIMVKNILKTYPKPYQLWLTLNPESERDIRLLCEQEQVVITQQEIYNRLIQLCLVIK